MPPLTLLPPNSGAGPLKFRPEAVRFRLHRNLGTLVLLRPPALHLLTLFPIAVTAILLFAGTRLTIRQRFTGPATAEHAGDRVVVTVEAGAASAIRLHDRVAITRIDDAGSRDGRAPGEVVSIEHGSCSAAPLAVTPLGAGTQPRRCLALGIAPGAPFRTPRSPELVEVLAPTQTYLDYLFSR